MKLPDTTHTSFSASSRVSVQSYRPVRGRRFSGSWNPTRLSPGSSAFRFSPLKRRRTEKRSPSGVLAFARNAIWSLQLKLLNPFRLVLVTKLAQRSAVLSVGGGVRVKVAVAGGSVAAAVGGGVGVHVGGSVGRMSVVAVGSGCVVGTAGDVVQAAEIKSSAAALTAAQIRTAIMSAGFRRLRPDGVRCPTADAECSRGNGSRSGA